MNNYHADIDIEKKVLGALIIEPQLLTEFYNKLSINLFTSLNHQSIYKAMVDSLKEHKMLDMIILSSELKKRNLEELTTYLIELAMGISSTVHTEFHIMILVQLSVKRDFIQKFTYLLNMAQAPDKDIFDIRDKAFEYFDDLFLEKFIENNRKEVTFSDLVEKVEKKIDQIKEGNITGIQSSLNIINKALGGWQKTNLSVVAGRPGMGKTAFLVQQAIDVIRQGKSVGIFSLEMVAEQIATRIITNYTNIPNSSFLRKGLKDDEIIKYIELKTDLLNMNVHIDETSSISIDNLKMKAKMMKLRHNIDILFIDYLQLITSDRAKNREHEISMISRELKGIAKDLNIPVVALSQLSRNVEQRADKRPLLSDLRDSGAIEQDADEVIFLYRPEYYGIDTWDHRYNNAPTDNEAEILIAKNRYGGTLSERCKVNMATSKFMNIN